MVIKKVNVTSSDIIDEMSVQNRPSNVNHHEFNVSIMFLQDSTFRSLSLVRVRV